jgi:hypothetical protein
MLVTRLGVQKNPNPDAKEDEYGLVRTLSTFKIMVKGEVQIEGYLVESRGPSTSQSSDGHTIGYRILANTYALWTHYTADFRSQGYKPMGQQPRPGIMVDQGPVEKGGCGRSGICVHPAHEGALYLSSIGCLNPTTVKLMDDQDIDQQDSYDLVVKIIDSLKAFEPVAFKTDTGTRFNSATIQIVEAPPGVVLN